MKLTDTILFPKFMANRTKTMETKPMTTATTLLMMVACLSEIFRLHRHKNNGRTISSITTVAVELNMELIVLQI